MSGDEFRFYTFRVEYSPGSDGRSQNGRLRGLGEFEALFGSFEAAFRKLVAQSFVGLVESLLRHGKFRGQVAAHSNGLGSLAGEDESYRVVSWQSPSFSNVDCV